MVVTKSYLFNYSPKFQPHSEWICLSWNYFLVPHDNCCLLWPLPSLLYGEWNGDSLQYSCLGNPMDRGAWQAIVHGVTKSWTWLNGYTATITVVTNVLVMTTSITAKWIGSLDERNLFLSFFFFFLGTCFYLNFRPASHCFQVLNILWHLAVLTKMAKVHISIPQLINY